MNSIIQFFIEFWLLAFTITVLATLLPPPVQERLSHAFGGGSIYLFIFVAYASLRFWFLLRASKKTGRKSS